MTRSEYLRMVCERIERELFGEFPNHDEQMTLDDIEKVSGAVARVSCELWGTYVAAGGAISRPSLPETPRGT